MEPIKSILKNAALIFAVVLCQNVFGQTLTDCSACSVQLVKVDQINKLSFDEIRYLTNDLYARKGFVFKNSNIDYYYSEKSWYKPMNSNDEIVFNAIENQNIKLFQGRAAILKADREKLLNALKAFKQLVLTEDHQNLKIKHKYITGKDSKSKIPDENDEDQFGKFKQLLIKLDFEDLNWIKDTGFYKLSIDNLQSTINYEIKIVGNTIYLTYDYDSGSDEISDEIYPIEHFVEFTYFWGFEWVNGELLFVKHVVAG